MILLIPLGGTGQRFKKEGYVLPKALIKVMGKPILYWLLDNIHDPYTICIPYNKEYTSHHLEDKLKNRYPQHTFLFIQLQEETRGAAETIHIALSQLTIPDTGVMCMDGDNFYTTDVISMNENKNTVVVFPDESPEPLFSYVTVDSQNNIVNMVEKDKISDLACTGVYSFYSYKQLNHYCEQIISRNIRQKGEFYTSTVIREMMADNITFETHQIKKENYRSLGTPAQVNEFTYTFLFDLDGTLVHTDHVYINVWNDILRRYNLSIDEAFFDNFIKGKSDNLFLTFLIPEITDTQINEISNEKDEKFIERLKQEQDTSILIPGAKEFMESIKDCNIAIVTNCNRKSANYILEKTGLSVYIDHLVSADDCHHTKPHPEPYQKAMCHFGVLPDRCIVFEDTYTGYLSAKKACVYSITMVMHDKSSDDVRSLKRNKIENYVDICINRLLHTHSKQNEYIDIIYKTLSYLPIRTVEYNNENIKTGYICDIDSYKITFNDGDTQDIILKISNSDNELSKTAKKLNMYQNEAYFYEHISKLVNVNVPNHYGIIENQDKQGILMGNLLKYKGSFNINLNQHIDPLLRVVRDIFGMHKKFYVRSEDELIESMKPLLTVNKIEYYQTLIEQKFHKFMEKNKMFISERSRTILQKIYHNFSDITDEASTYPLTLCHGDLKSPNIFYRNNETPYYLDWQYVHLNKGISDIMFLLVESIEFDKNIVEIVIRYYYQLMTEYNEQPHEDYLEDVQRSLCVFPFFVCVWFNSEDTDKLLDKSFPIRFMKNLLQYYDYVLSDSFSIN